MVPASTTLSNWVFLNIQNNQTSRRKELLTIYCPPQSSCLAWHLCEVGCGHALQDVAAGVCSELHHLSTWVWDEGDERKTSDGKAEVGQECLWCLLTHGAVLDMSLWRSTTIWTFDSVSIYAVLWESSPVLPATAAREVTVTDVRCHTNTKLQCIHDELSHTYYPTVSQNKVYII